METLTTVFGLELTGFGVSCALALLTLFIAMLAACRLLRVKLDVVPRFAVLAVPLALVCARLVFCLGNITRYLTTLGRPELMLRLTDGGFSLMGALIGVVLAAVLTAKWQHLPTGRMLDVTMLGAGFALCVERMGEGGTGMGLGRPIVNAFFLRIPFCTAWDEAMGQTVHAVFRYEAVAALLIAAGLLIYFLCVKGRTGRDGDLALMFLTLFGSAQVLLESLRNDGHLVVHFVRIQQVLAILLPVLALVIWSTRLVKARGTCKGLPLASWLLCAGAIALGVVQEFAIDSSENLLMDYGIMALCLTVLCVMPLWCHHALEKRMPKNSKAA